MLNKAIKNEKFYKKQTEISKSNEIREQIGLRKVETRNQLIDMQNKTQMDFFLPIRPMKNGKVLAN